jgi:predicted metal-dependent hydrolase
MYLFNYDKNHNELFYVQSSVDNKKYLVQNLQDKQTAADTLAQIRRNLEQVVEHMRNNKKYQRDDRVRRLVEKFNPNNMMETEPDSKYTSFSVNKGEKIHMCLRSRDGQNKIEEMNTLMFVALHELAHIATKSVGHTKEFWDNFRFLLERGIEIGVYTPVDYSKEPKSYCGIEVTDTPLNLRTNK